MMNNNLNYIVSSVEIIDNFVEIADNSKVVMKTASKDLKYGWRK